MRACITNIHIPVWKGNKGNAWLWNKCFHNGKRVRWVKCMQKKIIPSSLFHVTLVILLSLFFLFSYNFTLSHILLHRLERRKIWVCPLVLLSFSKNCKHAYIPTKKFYTKYYCYTYVCISIKVCTPCTYCTYVHAGECMIAAGVPLFSWSPSVVP